MGWSEFIYFAIAALSMWIAGTILLYLKDRTLAGYILIVSGLATFSLFIILLWIKLGHPPLRTMGETRLWYSLFLVLVGYAAYKRWGYKWLMAYSVIVSGVFVLINILKPGIHNTALMPALRSVWFVPHVTVYILSYAMMEAATISSLATICKRESVERNPLIELTDNLVNIGLGFLLLGMLMGAIWAKAAWGDYWSWDPKEVWAFITASAYILYIHSRHSGTGERWNQWIIPVAFILLMITWLGVSYLPAAQGSIHTY